MKKLAILTSMLVLAACGGGSGGGSGGSGVGVTPVVNAPRAADMLGNTAAASNGEITSVASAIVVSDNGLYHDVVASRSAHAPDSSHAGYKIYKLDNIDFKLIEDNAGLDSAFNFELANDGHIEEVVAKLGGTELNAIRGTESGKTDKFYGKIFQFVKDGEDTEIITIADDGNVTSAVLEDKLNDAVNAGILTSAEANNGHWNHLEQYWQFDTRGGQSGLGLTYSDFGYMMTFNTVKDEHITVNSDKSIDVDPANHHTGNENTSGLLFAGGYNIPNSGKADGMKFTGKAVGIVTASIDEPNGQAYYKGTVYKHGWEDQANEIYNHGEMALLTADTATLEIKDGGKEVLDMKFGSDGTARDMAIGADVDWYDVKVTKDGDNLNFEFITPEGSSIPDRFSYDNTKPHSVPVVKNADMGYYGINTPEEATGAVYYKDIQNITEEGHPNATREFMFQGAYGTTINTQNP